MCFVCFFVFAVFVVVVVGVLDLPVIQHCLERQVNLWAGNL